jgi:hypothetical protein
MTQPTSLGDTPIAQFFREFERRASDRDGAAQAEQFADSFLAAGPQGAQCVRASDFALALPKRKELFEKLGCRRTTLAFLEETRLDERYLLVRTRWCMEFGQPGRETKELLVGSVFIIDTGTPEFKIVLYLANQDILTELKVHGIGTA